MTGGMFMRLLTAMAVDNNFIVEDVTCLQRLLVLLLIPLKTR